jgi:hypothetical protein
MGNAGPLTSASAQVPKLAASHPKLERRALFVDVGSSQSASSERLGGVARIISSTFEQDSLSSLDASFQIPRESKR